MIIILQHVWLNEKNESMRESIAYAQICHFSRFNCQIFHVSKIVQSMLKLFRIKLEVIKSPYNANKICHITMTVKICIRKGKGHCKSDWAPLSCDEASSDCCRIFQGNPTPIHRVWGLTEWFDGFPEPNWTPVGYFDEPPLSKHWFLLRMVFIPQVQFRRFRIYAEVHWDCPRGL